MKYINLTQGKRAMVDNEDYERINANKWCYARTPRSYRDRKLNPTNWKDEGYATRCGGKDKKTGKTVTIYMHDVVMNLAKNAKRGVGAFVDHKGDRHTENKLDNRKTELRIVTPSQNCRNKRSWYNKKSKLPKGVYKSVSAKLNPFFSQIWDGSKNVTLGFFSSKMEAARAYDKAVTSNWGEFAKVNYK